MNESGKKILVRVPQWLGDAVVSTMFLSRLKEREPHARISILTVPHLKSLFDAHPAVDSVLTLPPKKSWEVWNVGRGLQSQGFNEIYVLPRSARAVLEAWFSKIPSRIGFGGKLRGWFFTKTAPYDGESGYARRYLALMDGEAKTGDFLRPFFPKSEPPPGEMSSIFGKPFASLKRPLLGLAPCSIASSRTWGADRFAELGNRFVNEKKGTVLLFGSASEREAVGRLAQEIKGAAVNTAGKLSLPHLGWIISRLNYFAANDSGLMHAASAFDIPAVIVFGAGDSRRALPRRPGMTAIQRFDIPCVPCLRNTCVRFGRHHRECLTAITVDEAWRALFS